MLHSIEAGIRNGVVALGNFDGVHRGHQAVVRTAVGVARAQGIPAVILTFEPHPRSVFQPDAAPFRLTPAPVKERLLRALGVDGVVVMPFTPDFSRLSAEEFVRQILIEGLGAKHIVAGYDYVFGHKRGGTMSMMVQLLEPSRIGVTEVAPLRDEQGEAMSSSRIREALRQGDAITAARILGRTWSIAGVVQHGAKRGASIGVPTANISLGDYLRPRFGVYVVEARREGDATTWRGVANIGTRPTVDGKTETLEAHLFDFNQTIYDEAWEFDLIDFMRPEQRFESFEELKVQIEKDVKTARSRTAI